MPTSPQDMEVPSLPIRRLGADFINILTLSSGDDIQVLEVLEQLKGDDGIEEKQKLTPEVVESGSPARDGITSSYSEWDGITEAFTRTRPQNCVTYSYVTDLADISSFVYNFYEQDQQSFTDAGKSEGVLLPDKDLTTSLNHQYRFNQEFIWDNPIGKGDFGSVMACHDWTTKKKIATKKIQKENFRPFEVIALTEVGSMQFIIGFLGVTTEDSTLYLHMELFEGARHLQYFGQEGLNHLRSQFKIVQIDCQLLQALDYLSRKQIIHRDLTGKNIMLTAAPVVKVIDFGLAVRAPYKQNTDDKPTGDYLYFAPEIVDGVEYISTASDVWAAAINIIYLLRGSSVCKHCDEGPGKENHPLMCSHLNHCHPDLYDLLKQMLQVEWRKRPSPYKLLHHKIFQVCCRELERYPVRLAASKRNHPDRSKSDLFVDGGVSLNEDDSGYANGINISVPSLVDSMEVTPMSIYDITILAP